MIKRRIAAAAAGFALVIGGVVATSSTTDDTSANGLRVSSSQSQVVKANGHRQANGL
jgi:hypothetical protein